MNAVILYFWNDGKMPIRSDDVLDPVRVSLEPGCEIIDARILKIGRPVTGIAKGDVIGTATNELPITFKILEHNDGAAVQIIYTGNPDAQTSLTGTIVGAGSPRQTRYVDDPIATLVRGSPRDRRHALAFVLIGLVLAVPVHMGLFQWIELLFRRLARHLQIPRWELFPRKLMLYMTFGFLFGIAFASLVAFWSGSPGSQPIPTSIQIEQR